MIIKRTADHNVVETPTCGEIREVLDTNEYPGLSIALAIDIKETRGHFHTTFDEIYFLLDGSLVLELFDPATERRWTEPLVPNELCVITAGLHHKVREYSTSNRLCVMCRPHFDSSDEHLSKVLG